MRLTHWIKEQYKEDKYVFGFAFATLIIGITVVISMSFQVAKDCFAERYVIIEMPNGEIVEGFADNVAKGRTTTLVTIGGVEYSVSNENIVIIKKEK